MNRIVDIPAIGSVQETLGVFKFLRVTVAAVPFQISFNGSLWQDAKQNNNFPNSDSSHRVYFRAVGGLAVSVTFAFSSEPIIAQDTAQSSVTTTARGCGGSGIALTVNKAKAQGGADYTYNAGNPVDLTAANTVKFVSGNVNGLKRKTIYFNNKNSATDICIFDAAGNLWLYLKAGADSPVFETSSDYYLGGMAGNSTNFIYCETFYEKSNS